METSCMLAPFPILLTHLFWAPLRPFLPYTVPGQPKGESRMQNHKGASVSLAFFPPCSWDSFSVVRLPCQPLFEGFLPCFIVSCFVLFGCCVLEACSFLKEKRRGLDLKKRCGEGLGSFEWGKTVVRMYCVCQDVYERKILSKNMAKHFCLFHLLLCVYMYVGMSVPQNMDIRESLVTVSCLLLLCRFWGSNSSFFFGGGFLHRLKNNDYCLLFYVHLCLACLPVCLPHIWVASRSQRTSWILLAL